MSETRAGISRRGLFRRGLLGGALLTVGGGTHLALRRGRGDLSVPSGLRSLSAATYPVMYSIAEAVLPEPAAAATVTLAVDDSLSYASPRARQDLNQALGLLENGLAGLFTRGSGAPFSLLALSERRAALLKWQRWGGLLQGAAHALRRLALAAYYSSDEAARGIGYPGPLFEKPSAPPIEPRAPLSPPFQLPAPALNPTAPPAPRPSNAAPTPAGSERAGATRGAASGTLEVRGAAGEPPERGAQP